jgi:hypothetical protein
MKLYEKLHAVMTQCAYIKKDKVNSFHKYSYASEAAIKEKLHQSLVANRVVFLPTSARVVNRETGLGKDGKEALTTVRLTYRFVDIDNGESVEGEFDGVGSDALDKGCYKAITGAIKYILTSTFLIETGDDPEQDDEKPTKPAASSPRSATVNTVTTAPPNDPPALALMYQKAAKGQAVQVFKDLHGTFAELLGTDNGDAAFRAIVASFGKEKIAQFTSLDEAKKCIKKMYEAACATRGEVVAA